MKLVSLLISLPYLKTAVSTNSSNLEDDPEYYYENYDDYGQWTEEESSMENNPMQMGRSLGIGSLDFESDNPFGGLGGSLDMGPGSLDARKLSQTWKILAHIAPNIQAGFVPKREKKNNHKLFIKNHGCYCHTSKDRIVGPRNGYSGEPLDELDALCLALYKAQKCMTMEVESKSGEECSVKRGYPFTLNHEDGLSPDEMIDCYPKRIAKEDSEAKDLWVSKRKNGCRHHVCSLEKEFAIRVKQLYDSGYRQADTSIVNLKNNKYVSKCSNVLRKFDDDMTVGCCGNGISRRPFDVVNKQCCPDERLAPVGSC